jgi:hypothetical protein
VGRAMAQAGIQPCIVCEGRGRVAELLHWYPHEAPCPCCRGSGEVCFREHEPGRPNTGKHADSWQAAMDATDYSDYVRRCREAGMIPVYREAYEQWRRRARARGLL